MIFYSFIWIYIFPIYMLTPLISISFNSWFSIWISIEMNLMSFIPLIIFINKFYKELVMKYFIIQSISSMMIILSSNLILIINNYFYLKFLLMLINLSLFIKLGIPPFHYWFISMMNNMNWLNCFFLSTWQKIIPMILLMYNFLNEFMYYFIIISSLTSFFGINHQSLRLIMAYSSINHMSWMLLNLMISENLWILYFISYTIINMSIMLILNKFKMFYLNQINNFKFLNFKLIFILNFFSISSLPPLFGFLMKWFSIYSNINNKINFIILLMMLISLLTFMFYMKISINLLLNFKIINKINILNKFLIFKKMNFLNYFFLLTFNYLWMINIWMI
uniref:NADH-ubiquinone oxidoreductase chain 2 n=1 Tax=Hyposoter sp. ZJUH_2016018 TaxID=2491160 RepID=A0A3S8V0V1_9HYME|nr:NADH dehydrogenase subunit 2 [Hyposoter sp. ZJUH_2016018]